MLLYKIMSNILKVATTEFKKNFKSTDISLKTLKKYIKTDIIVHSDQKTVEGYLYINTALLQEREEADAIPSQGLWSRYKFTYGASAAYGGNHSVGDNTIGENYVSWHMVRWLEKGMRVNPEAHYRGNMARRKIRKHRVVYIPHVWRKVGMFQKTYEYLKTHYSSIVDNAIRSTGVRTFGNINGQPKVKR